MPPISRRSLVKGGLSLTLAGAMPSFAFADGQLVVTDPGGSSEVQMAKGFYKPFEEATGIKVLYSARPNQAMGQLKSMVLANNVEWDVTYLSDYLTNLAIADDLLDPIDTSKMDPKLLAQMLPGSVSKYLIAGSIYGTAFGYSTKVWKTEAEAPQSWADFWDVKRFPGRRSMIGAGYGPIEQALLADGVPRDELYPLDLDRAYAKLDQIRPHVTVWTTASAQQHQLLVNDEVDLIHGFANRIKAAMDDGAEAAIVWRDCSLTYEGWVLPKRAKNRELALKFIEFALDPKRQADAVTGSAPTNSLAGNFLDPALAKLLPSYPANFATTFQTDAKWLADNQDQLQSRWTKWRASKG